MKFCQTSLITGLLISSLSACQVHTETPITTDIAAQLQQTALASSLGYEIVESLTVEVGPRLAGSPKDPIAVDWAINKLTSLGFDKVYKEPVQVPIWERGEAKAKIISPVEQPLVITALGGSIATPVEGIKAKIARFDNLEALQQADPNEVKGKIAFIDHKTERHISGDGYSKSVGGRSKGAVAAAQKGAVAVIIRSIGTDHDRMAHTGVMRYQDGVAKIPAAAMSNPDADLVDAMLKRDPNTLLELHMSPKDLGTNTSYNVIAEVTGNTKPNEIVVIGAHLDSWDEGTGAIDDGAGVAIVTAAAKHIQDLPQKPARTVRVVLYAAEEIGLLGGKAYAEAHKAEMPLHYIAAESDFGAGPIYQIDSQVNENVFAQFQKIIKPMTYNGVAIGNNQASGGPDISMLPALAVPVASLRQNGHDYFDYHHTPNDTLDKIDPKALAQNVAAYAQFAYIMANASIVLTPLTNKTSSTK